MTLGSASIEVIEDGGSGPITHAGVKIGGILGGGVRRAHGTGRLGEWWRRFEQLLLSSILGVNRWIMIPTRGTFLTRSVVVPALIPGTSRAYWTRLAIGSRRESRGTRGRVMA